ncbi:hypothetical protein YC2023_013400 [Brassica napus]
MFPRLKRPLLINENLTKIRINGLISYLGNASVISRGASWGSNQQSLKTGNGKEEKEVQSDTLKEIGMADAEVYEWVRAAVIN